LLEDQKWWGLVYAMSSPELRSDIPEVVMTGSLRNAMIPLKLDSITSPEDTWLRRQQHKTPRLLSPVLCSSGDTPIWQPSMCNIGESIVEVVCRLPTRINQSYVLQCVAGPLFVDLQKDFNSFLQEYMAASTWLVTVDASA
jgi:hypothetical protein